MKTVALSAVVAAVAAWAVVTLTAPDAGAPSYDPVALDLEDRLASLEGRIARLANELEAPELKTAENPDETKAALVRRIEALEEELRRLRGGSSRPGTTPPPGGPRPGTSGGTGPDGQGTPPSPPHGRVLPRAKKAGTMDFEAALERIRRSDASAEERAKQLSAVAVYAGRDGRFELQEAILRELIETAGEDSRLAQESLYDIGWSRKNAGNAEGAREAWLEANEKLPRDHWRRGYARYYAAEQGVKAGERAAAERELEDLIRDIEARPEVVDRHGTLIKRSRALLATLGR